LFRGQLIVCGQTQLKDSRMTPKSSILKMVLRALSLMSVMLILPLSLPRTASATGSFGIEQFTAVASNSSSPGSSFDEANPATPDSQAGGHPYEYTASVNLNTEPPTLVEPSLITPAGNVRDLIVTLPNGLIFDPRASPQCPLEDMTIPLKQCPPETQVGVAKLSLNGGLRGEEASAALYDLTPPTGQYGELGFVTLHGTPVTLSVSVNVEAGYAVEIKLGGAPRAGVTGIALTLWGTPADEGHDQQRPPCLGNGGISPLTGESCPSAGSHEPMLTNSTNCQVESLAASASADSWEQPGVFQGASTVSPAPTGCEQLQFPARLKVTPETTNADAPSGYSFEVGVPPVVGSSGQIHDAMMTLPPGLTISASGLSALQGCPEVQVGQATNEPVACPSSSQLGTVTIMSSLSATPLTGSVFLLAPECSPCGTSGNPQGLRLNLLLEAQGSGMLVEAKASLTAQPDSGELMLALEELPPLLLSSVSIQFDGGAHALLVNPTHCGTEEAVADVVPWSGGPGGVPNATSASPLEVVGSDGGACSSAVPFAPAFSAHTSSSMAAGFSSLELTVSRADTEQSISMLHLQAPSGFAAQFAGIPQCSEGQIEARACTPGSRVGSAALALGPGASPTTLAGTVYLTGPHNGAPFGLVAMLAAQLGPFDLGTIVVRVAVDIAISDGHLVFDSDPLPQTLDGVPLRVRTLSLSLNRVGFLRNATSCMLGALLATISGTSGTVAADSSPLTATNCSDLPFVPKLAASGQAQSGHANGAALSLELHSASGTSGPRTVQLQLPSGMLVDSAEYDHACAAAVFIVDPSRCGPQSVVGVAQMNTSLLAFALAGPIYMLSSGDSSSNLAAVLQGDGVTLELRGSLVPGTQKRVGLTLGPLPDIPIGLLSVDLPRGPYSALRASSGLCVSNAPAMAAQLVAQDGEDRHLDVAMHLRGCARTELAITPRHAVGDGVPVLLRIPASGRVILRGPDIRPLSWHSSHADPTAKLTLTKAGLIELHRRHNRLRLRVTVHFIGAHRSVHTSAYVVFR
jgi:hypothetical protein